MAAIARGAAAEPVHSRIFSARDSTAADCRPERRPQTGWDMMLNCGLQPGIEVVNPAAEESTRRFVSEGLWARLLSRLLAQDTGLIAFVHNDAKAQRSGRFAPADTVYRANLEHFIKDVRALGAVPILITPVMRRAFGPDGTIADTGLNDYARVVREVAATRKAPLIDLNLLSRSWLAAVGEARSRAFYFHYDPMDHVTGFLKGLSDDKHFSERGARRVA
ncbi:MAG: GDSL-type esterase/lipase family protein [Luteolibacter sp.]